MKVDHFEIGQHLFQSAIFRNGHDVDDGSGDCFDTRAEAEEQGEEMVAGHDPEWQKRNPGCIAFSTREYVVDSVGADGAWGGYTID